MDHSFWGLQQNTGVLRLAESLWAGQARLSPQSANSSPDSLYAGYVLTGRSGAWVWRKSLGVIPKRRLNRSLKRLGER